MTVSATVDSWILPDNLYLFVERVSVLIGYGFDDSDWDAIRFGVRDDTDILQDLWYEYELIGKSPVQLSFAGAMDAKRLRVKAETDGRTAERIVALTRIMQCYRAISDTNELQILIAAAFIATPMPEPDRMTACDHAHLASCRECQYVLAFFGGRHWLTLLRDEAILPRGYVGLGFLTAEAGRFFFPAYLVKALRDKDFDLLETAMERVAQDHWTPLQHELIDFVRHLLEDAPVG